MSDFTEDTLHYLEKLSYIQCDPKEEEQIMKSLKNILDYVEQLDQIEITEESFDSSFLPLTGHELREDLVQDSLRREDYLENIPKTMASMIQVPPVLSAKGQ